MKPIKVLTTAGLIVALGGVVANTTAFSVKYKELKQNLVDVKDEMEEVNGQTRSELKALINETKQGLTSWTAESLNELSESIQTLKTDVEEAVEALQGVDAQLATNITNGLTNLFGELNTISEKLDEEIQALKEKDDALDTKFMGQDAALLANIGAVKNQCAMILEQMRQNKAELAGLIAGNAAVIEQLSEDLRAVEESYATKVELQETAEELTEKINFNSFNIWQIKMQLEAFNGQFARRMKAYFNNKLTQVYEEYPGKVYSLAGTLGGLLLNLKTPLNDAEIDFDGDEDFDEKDAEKFVYSTLGSYTGIYSEQIRHNTLEFYLPFNYGPYQNAWANVVAPLWQEGTTLITLAGNWWESANYFEEYETRIENTLAELEYQKDVLSVVDDIWKLPHLNDKDAVTATTGYVDSYKWCKSYFVNKLVKADLFGYLNIEELKEFTRLSLEDQEEEYDGALDFLGAFKEAAVKFDGIVDELETLYDLTDTNYKTAYEGSYAGVKTLVDSEAKGVLFASTTNLNAYLAKVMVAEEGETLDKDLVDTNFADFRVAFDIVNEKGKKFIDVINAFEKLDSTGTKGILSGLSKLADDADISTAGVQYGPDAQAWLENKGSTETLLRNKDYVEMYKDGDSDSVGFDAFDALVSDAVSGKTEVKSVDDVDAIVTYILGKMGANDIRMQEYNKVYNAKLAAQEAIKAYTFDMNGDKSIKAFVDALENNVTVAKFLEATDDSDDKTAIESAATTFQTSAVDNVKALAGTQVELEDSIKDLLDKAGTDLTASALATQKTYMENVIGIVFDHYSYVDASGAGALKQITEGDTTRDIVAADITYSEFHDTTVETDYEDVIADDIDTLKSAQVSVSSYNDYVNMAHDNYMASWKAQGHTNSAYALTTSHVDDGITITEDATNVAAFNSALEAAHWVTGGSVEAIPAVPSLESKPFATVMTELDTYINADTGSVSAKVTELGNDKQTLDAALAALTETMTTQFNTAEDAYITTLKTLYGNNIDSLLTAIKADITDSKYELTADQMTSLENKIQQAKDDLAKITDHTTNSSADVVSVFKYWFGEIKTLIVNATSNDEDAITTLNTYRADCEQIALPA